MNQNALHFAAKNSRTDKSVINLLIEKGVDVTCKDTVISSHFETKKLVNVAFSQESCLISWDVEISECSFDSITCAAVIWTFPHTDLL